jgi:hypothetical protein
MIRLVHLLKCQPGLSGEAFDLAWRDRIGPAFAGSQVQLGILRHVQTCRSASTAPLEAAAQADRAAMLPPADGVAESWWPSQDALAALLASADGRRGLEKLAGRLAEIADPAASPLWLAHEYPQVATSAARIHAGVRTGVVKVHFALRPCAHLGEAEAQAYWLTRHGPLVRSHALARGALAYCQVHRTHSPLTAELAAIFGAPVGDYIGHAEAWFDRSVSRSGPEADAAKAAAIADERNFIDWSRSSLLAGKERVFVERDW